MAKEYILVCDEGTTGLRGVVFNRKMEIVGQHYEKITSYYPGPSEVEQDGEEIWEKQVLALREAVKKAGITPEEIAAVGVTHQRGTHGYWNRKTGKVHGRFMVWQDTRGLRVREQLMNDEAFLKMTEKYPVVRLTTQTMASAMPGCDRAMFDEHPELLEEIRNDPDAVWGGIDTWLLYKLTGGKVFAACASHAGTLPIFSHDENQFIDEALAFAYIGKAMMPEVLPDVYDYGMMTADVLGIEIPIKSCVADQQSALFSEGGQGLGSAKCTMGTGTFVDINIGLEHPMSGAFFPICAWEIDGVRTYMYEAAVTAAGTSLEWAKSNLKLFDSFGEMDDIALSVEDNAGVYFVPGLSGMDSAPFLNTTGRGSFMGLEARSTRAHFVRALLESFGYSVAYLVEEIGLAVPNFKVGTINVDGGVSRSKVVCQSISDLLGVRVIRQKADEATAMGAAELAAINLGWFGPEDVSRFIIVDKEYTPSGNAAKLKANYKMWRKAVERSKNWVED